MALKLNSSGGGSVTLDAPVTANNYTLTAPASSGTIATTDGGNTTFTSITDSGNLTFTGTGNRITGDFSNSTIASKISFQTSTVNGGTYPQVLPNGTNTNSGFLAFNNSDPTNAAYSSFLATSIDARLVAGITGTGTYLPMTFYTGGSERMRIDTSGNVGIGTNSVTSNAKLQVTGGDDTYVFVKSDGAGDYSLSLGSGGTPLIARGAGAPLAFGTVTNNSVITGWSEQMRIDSSGNVGIGTSAPKGCLDVVGTGSSAARNWAYVQGGNVGAQNPAAGFGAGIAFGTNFSNGNSETNLVWGNTVGSGQYFSISKWTGSAVTEQMRISSSGNVGIGVAPSGVVRLHVQGSTTNDTAYMCVFENSSGGDGLWVRNDGYINTGVLPVSPYNATTAAAANLFVYSDGGLYRSTSSIKYKKNVNDATHGLAELLMLRPVTYEGTGKADEGKKFGGLIAEEVHDAGLAEFVQYAEDGTPDALAYGNMVALCIKAIQELKAELDELKAKVK